MADEAPGRELGDAQRRREIEILGQPPRLPPLTQEECGPEARALSARLMQAIGRPWGVTTETGEPRPVSEQIAILLRHRDLYRAHLETGIVLLQGALPPRDRELVILRTGWLCQAPLEWCEHVAIAKRMGVSSAEIEQVVQGSSAPGWDAHDQALLRAVEELHAGAMISDETWAALAERLTPEQLIELPILVGQYMTVAFYQNALRIRLTGENGGLSAR